MLKELPVRQRGVCCDIRIDVDGERLERKAELLRALADPTRLGMVAALRAARQPICICDFTAAFNLSQPTISHHMAKLREAGLVDYDREGIWTHYWLRDDLPPTILGLLDAVAA